MRIWRALLAAALVVGCGLAQAAPPIPAGRITASASSSFIGSLTGPGLTIDGSGLTGDLHGNSPSGEGMWLSANGGGGNGSNNPAGVDGPAWLRYRFDVSHTLDSAWIWNHNQANLTDRGLRNISIHVREDGEPWQFVGDYTLTRASGTAGYAHGDEIDFGGIEARDLLLTVSSTDGNYGSTYYGLSEIRFFAEPAPCWPADFPVQVVSVEKDMEYTHMLRHEQVGWLGSDVAKSIPLPDGRVVWLFGDTLVGRVIEGKRDSNFRFLNNTIGIQDTNAPTADAMTYYWGSNNTSFFPHQTGTPGQFYWPTSGFYHDGDLYIFCYSVSSGFVIGNATMIRVLNPEQVPTMWQWTAVDFGIGAGDFGFHTGFYIEEPYLFMLGYVDRSDGRHGALARMELTRLEAGETASAMEYWTTTGGDPAWSESPNGLVPLFSPGVTESDIQYLPEYGLYITTAYDPFQGSAKMVFAPELTGPWSDPFCLFDVPEFGALSFDIIAYAIRPHPQLARHSGELIFSYATNTFGSLDPLFTVEGFNVYVPQFMRVRLPVAGVECWTLH